MSGIDKRITVAITGASGIVYGATLVTALSGRGCEVKLVVSDAGRGVMKRECDLQPESLVKPGVTLFEDGDLFAPIASGSYKVEGMVIAPCTMASLSAVACGKADTLIHRAADVCLKEGRPLILVTRETPLSRIHIRNMLNAAEAGALIMPASPPFYGRPSTIDDLVSHLVGRVLDRLGIENDLAPRWQG